MTKHCCCYGHRVRMKGVKFVPFQSEKSEHWIRACRREGFGVDNVKKHTYIYALHLICL